MWKTGATFIVKKPQPSFLRSATLVRICTFPLPRTHDHVLQLLSIYTPEMWALFIGTIMVLLLIVLFYRKFDRKRSQKRCAFCETFA